MEKKGIKEIVEFLDGLKLLVNSADKIMEDDKISFNDFPILVELIKEYKILVDAGKGLDLAVLEAKDLDKDELVIVFEKVIGIFKKMKEI